MPRALLLFAVASSLSACAASGSRNWPVASGGSVADFDRGVPLAADVRSSGAAGANETIGAVELYPHRAHVARYAFGPGVAVAGPAVALHAPTVRTVLAAQRLLAARGYYHGPLNGVADAALLDAVYRFQLDADLPLTGQLDGATAAALGVPSDAPSHRG